MQTPIHIKKSDSYHHGNLKEEFIQIAFDVIAKDDIDHLTLKILSDETGTSRSAIYKHFSSKDALIETIIIKGFEQFDVLTGTVLSDKTKPLIDRFYITGKLYLEFAEKNPNLYRLLFGKKYAHLRNEIMSIKDEDCSGFGKLKLAVEEGQKSGILKQESSFVRTIMIWSSLHGLSSLIIDGFMDIGTSTDALYETLFEDLLSLALAKKVKLVSSLPFVKRLLEPNRA